MGKKIDYKEKFLLNDKQIDTIYKIHQKIIREGLTQMGVLQGEHNAFLDAAAITFETLIKETQAELLQEAEKAELRRDILKS